MLGERLAPCWCYSSIHLDGRKKRVSLHALVRHSVTLNTPCEVDQCIYFTPWRDTGLNRLFCVYVWKNNIITRFHKIT